MATISLKFTLVRDRISLCALTKEKGIRHYRVVTELKNPNLSKWDPRREKFASRGENDKKNNQILEEVLHKFQELLNQRDFDSGQQLFAYQKNLEKGLDPDAELLKTTIPKSSMTLGQWIQKIISDLMNPTRLKPSGSYQGYVMLYNKLEREGNLINMSLSDIDDNSFIQLIKWINRQKPTYRSQGNNFYGVMKMFRATISRAKKARIITYSPDFPFMDYAPIKKQLSENAKDILEDGGVVKSLTKEQYQQFLSLDLDEIQISNKEWRFREMYRDFCILLYEMKSRPIDIIKLHWDNIAYDKKNKRMTCTYIPAKKKNHGQGSGKANPLVIQYLTPKAVEIVNKYQAKSAGGYVFPFDFCNKKWDLNNPEEFRAHYVLANKLEGKINRFVHKISARLGFPFRATLYTFRRSAITHAIMENNIPLPMIAKIAGTSVEMIDKHYANYLHALAAY